MRSERTLVTLGLILISIIWGSTWLAIKIGLESIPPFYAVAIRFTLAAIILFILTRIRGDRLPTDRESLFLYAVLAVLSFSFPFALVYWGEQYIPSGLASILFAAYPFVVAIGSHFFLSAEKLNPLKVLGIVSGFIGVLVIFWTDLQLGSADTRGMLAVLLSTLMQGTSLVIVKRKGRNINPIVLSLGGMLIGIVILYALALAFEDFSTVHFDSTGIASILYLGTFGTVVTFVIYYWLLKRIEAVYLSLVSLVTPVLAVLLGTIWLKEDLSPRIYLGAILVLAGILIANGRDLFQVINSGKIKMFSQKR